MPVMLVLHNTTNVLEKYRNFLFQLLDELCGWHITSSAMVCSHSVSSYHYFMDCLCMSLLGRRQVVITNSVLISIW